MPDVARAQFEMAVWQLTNDLKKKFYTVILNQSLLNLARENEKTFAETIKHTEELVQAGEISGLDLTRLEVEKLKFDTDLANSERDYEVALRDLRVTLGGDYRAMDIEAAGTLDPQSSAVYSALRLACATSTFPATVVIPTTSTSGCRNAIINATASSEAVSVSIKKVRFMRRIIPKCRGGFTLPSCLSLPPCPLCSSSASSV